MFTCLECGYNTTNKSNYNRHNLSKHKKIVKNNNNESQNLNNIPQNLNNIPQNLNNIPQNLNNIPQNLNNESQILNNESQNLNNILPNQCEKCHKVLSSKDSLNRHMKTCSGPNKDKECNFCQKEFSTKQSKNRHELICKDKDKTINIINNNNNDNSTTNNNNTQNIQNIDNSIDNSINITVFNSDPKKTTKFDTHHITPDVLIEIFKQSMNNNIILSAKLLDVIWENVNNRCITKSNIKTNFSKVSGENGSWLSGLDRDIYPKFIKDAYKTSYKLINKYKPDLQIVYPEIKVDIAYVVLENMASLNMDDKKLTREYLKEDNFSIGISKEDSEEMEDRQMIENDQIDEFQRSYKRTVLKASDNAKRLLA